MAAVAPLYLRDFPADFPTDADWVNGTGVSLSGLRGRVVLLHFWSASHIHCRQTLLEIKALESKFSDGLAVVGIHTPRFAAEGQSETVLKAVNRLFLRFPVVNDAQWRLWRAFNIQAWPTTVLIDAEGQVVAVLVGENNKTELESRINDLLRDAQSKGVRSVQAAPTARKPEAKHALSFPSKLAAGSDRLFIADTGHNRVLECTFEGRVMRTYGSGNAGFWDGKASEAGLREPTGLALGKDCLFICDTGNHAVRRVKLLASEITVDTIAGTGKLGFSSPEEGNSRSLNLASPMDCVYANEKLYVALAGMHQIWAFDLLRNTAQRIAGSGAHGVGDGNLLAATFAQPTGLSLGRDALYVLDAGSSSLRQIKLSDASVTTLVGGDVFDSGDADGSAGFAKLQFPNACIFDAVRNVVWIADSYNNKIKVFSPAKNEVKTLNVNYKLQEPAGLALADNALWIANQNAHELLRLDLKTGKLSRIPVGEQSF
jgi:thiol-disulfide isomerase/thioredoxin/sugar lactone lactonase YvrE